jgi:hypothetical protein
MRIQVTFGLAALAFSLGIASASAESPDLSMMSKSAPTAMEMGKSSGAAFLSAKQSADDQNTLSMRNTASARITEQGFTKSYAPDRIDVGLSATALLTNTETSSSGRRAMQSLHGDAMAAIKSGSGSAKQMDGMTSKMAPVSARSLADGMK